MGSYRFGEVIFILFPFADHSGSKERPAVVISSPKFNRLKSEIILLPITSQLRYGDTYGTIAINDWRKAGLDRPSVIKPFPHTALQKQIMRKFGELTRGDKDQLREMLSEVISSDF